ncbi:MULTISPECIES: anti-sigma factor [Gordonia]|jgi:anti-sigma-K factor RskA|uniref:Regulator of SigK n=1 Tax=Gordonia tangerina TaxID=2911060 RepID=A0ABS9DSL8_9ACTN|nr:MULTISPECIES: anti-sigma factor [Gordonia]MAU82315.1 anti-sigma factor [Gordonia sp. (in: high G+C Gram-positive bacteria)]MAU84454.1 anti-sigma factor [Gordonia sp. (in: high G+C Gram-positive bacteria)]MCF3940818.1 anti-sigma factor [Gordonia tangerina]
MSDTDWLDDHIELYAVAVLPPTEHDRVERELADLSGVERRIYHTRVAETRAAMVEFASSYAIDAPGDLRARVLDHVFAVSDGRGDAVSSDGPSGDVTADSAPAPIPIDRARRRRRAAVIAAAAAAIVVALGAGVVIGRGTAPDPAAPTVTAAGQQALDVLTAPDAQLAAQQLDDDRGTMSVVTSRERNQAVALLRDLNNPIASDREFQLWLVGKEDQPVSAGLIPSTGADDPTLVENLDSATVLAVTVEPEGGSPQPTTPILAQVQL